MSQSCKNCRFWRDPKDSQQSPFYSGYGLCQRHAPTGAGGSAFMAPPHAVWPTTLAAQWCGDWERLPQAPTQQQEPKP